MVICQSIILMQIIRNSTGVNIKELKEVGEHEKK